VASHPDSPRPETKDERLDRNLMELLNELRVGLPGVQVLFAFLLVVPFNQRFTAATEFQRWIYFITLLLTAASAIFLIAPSFHHRLQFRHQEKEEVVLVGNALALIGLTLLALAMTGVVLLVTEFLFGGWTAAITTAAVAALFALVWYAIPVRRLLRSRRSSSASRV
jgi:drug/metabolite transporter (DMT)-like permease